MVVLTPRFAVLGAFVYLASLSLAPLSVGAAVIYRPSSMETRFSEPLSALDQVSVADASDDDDNEATGKSRNQARLATRSLFANVPSVPFSPFKTTKRHHKDINYGDSAVVEVDIRKRREQHHFHARRHQAGIAIPSKQGASYYVSPVISKGTANLKSGLTVRRDQGGILGHVDIMSPDSRKRDGEKIASLLMSDSADGGHVLNASENSATPMYLVSPPSTSRAQSETPNNAKSDVMLQVPIKGASEPHCVTYDTGSSLAEPLTVEKCGPQANENRDSRKSQTFAYNSQTGIVQPQFGQEADSSDSAQSVLERADGGTATDVMLKFVPDEPDAQQVADFEGAAVTSTSTTTTTVTVTSAPTPALSAADVGATSSVEPSPSSTVPALTSAADSSAPTAAPAGMLDVQVVGPASSSTAMLTSASEAPAEPTSTINAQDVAASIAASSAAPSLATDAVSATAPNATSSSMVAPSVAAVADSTPTSSGTTSSVAPTMSPFSTEPYKLKFRRE